MKKLFLILFLVVGYFANGQILQEPNVYGYKFKRVGSDSLHFIPSDTLRIPTLYNGLSWIAKKGTSLYYWNGAKWSSFSFSSSSFDTTSIYAAINGKADSLRRSGLAVQMRKNGNWTTQFNLPDSTGGSSLTFTNGLTESGGTVKLGGEMTDHIIITGDSTKAFQLIGLAETEIQSADAINIISALGTVILGGTSSINIAPDSVIFYQSSGNYRFKNLPIISSTTGRKVLVHDTATGKIERIDPSALGGATPAGNYGNVQINRNGTLSTPASDSLSFTDKLNVKGNIVGTSKLILGATAAPAQSQVYVTGGVSGGNIDARGDSSSAQKDEANIEVQHADYDGSSFTGYGVALQANGNVSSGTLLGYSNKNSAQLRFTGDVNVIRTLTNRSLRFGVNNVEKLVIDSIGRVGIGVINPDSTLHVNGSFKLVNGTQGAGKVLTSDANGGASWQTPATVADTSYTTIATFTAGGGFASDTTMCTDSTLFGSFFTGQFDYTIAYIQAVIKGNAGDSIVLKLVYNDTFNVDGTKVNGAGLSINNRYTGNVFTISTNRTIAANTWVWLKPEAVITGKKPKYISVTLVGYKTYVTP